MFDELFGGLDKKYTGKFDWTDIRDDQEPSLAALDSLLDKSHPLYYFKREAALAKREPGGDVLYLLEGGVYVIVNPTNPSYNGLGQLTYREFSNLQNTIRHIHEGYAEEHEVDARIESDQERAEILEETRDPKAYSKFWHLYHMATVAAHSFLLSVFGWFFNGLIVIMSSGHYIVPFTGDGDWRLIVWAVWIAINFAAYALLRLADRIVKRRTGSTMFTEKNVIKRIVFPVAALFAVTAAVTVPIAVVSESGGGYAIFYLFLMPLYMGAGLHSAGIYLFHSRLKDKIAF